MASSHKWQTCPVDRVPEDFVDRLMDAGHRWAVVGGAVLAFLEAREPRDIDIIVEGISEDYLEYIVREVTEGDYRRTSLGGYRFVWEGVSFDVWPEVSIEAWLEVPPYNLQMGMITSDRRWYVERVVEGLRDRKVLVNNACRRGSAAVDACREKYENYFSSVG